ncbi:MAG: thiamine-phosphate kinase [Erythrobacter sp.]
MQRQRTHAHKLGSIEATIDEHSFIEALKGLPLHAGARGLSDDAAILEIGGETLIVTHDAMAQGVHFRGDADMADVAWKLVATNLSDLAAKGAEPIGVVLGYTLGKGDDRFVQGLAEVTAHYNVPILGGDTIGRSDPISNQSRTFGLTAIGKATHSPVPSRTNARSGDHLWVTGVLGRAMLGFEGVRDHARAFNRPSALLDEGRTLAPHVTAMMDVSDGLLLDAFRMAQASEVTIAIDADAVPVAMQDRAEDCMRWGDDYELLFTLPPEQRPQVDASRIGTVEPRGFAPLIFNSEPIVNADGLGFRH